MKPKDQATVKIHLTSEKAAFLSAKAKKLGMTRSRYILTLLEGRGNMNLSQTSPF